MLKFNKYSKIIIISAVVLSVFIPTLLNVIQAHHTRIWNYQTTNYIYDLEISTDGRYLAVGTYDRLYFFDVFQNELLWDKYLQNLQVGSLSMRSDGAFFVAGVSILAPNQKGYVYYFDGTNSTPVWTYRTSLNRPPPVSISSDGKYIVAQNSSQTIILFENSDSVPLWNFTAEREISVLEISPDGNNIAIADLNGKIYFLNNSLLPSTRHMWNFTMGTEIEAITFSPNSEFLAVASIGNYATVFDKSNSTSKYPIWNCTTSGEITSIDISFNGNYVVVGSRDDTVYFFETNSTLPLWEYQSSTDILSVTYSDEGNYIGAGDLQGMISLLKSDDKSLVSRYRARGEPYKIKISSNGDYLFCASYYLDAATSEYRIYLFDRSDPNYGKDITFVLFTTLQNLLIYGIPTSILTISGAFLFEYLKKRRSIKRKKLHEKLEEEQMISKLDSPNLKNGIKKIKKNKSLLKEDTMLKFLTARKRKLFIGLLCISLLGSIGSITYITILNISGNLSWEFFLTNNSEEQYSRCAISEDGKYMVVGGHNDHLNIMEKSSPKPLWSYNMNGDILDVDISEDGQYIVAGASNGTLFLFERTNSNPIWIYSAESSSIRKVGIYSNGNYIIMLNELGKLFLFQKSSPTPLWNTTLTFSGSFTRTEISDEGNYITSVSSGIIKFYNTSSSTPMWQYDTGENVIGALSLSPDGDIVAVGGQDNKVHVFNKTGPTPIQIYSTEGTVRSLSISEEGNFIAAGCPEGVYLFNSSSSTRIWKYEYQILYSDSYQIAISSTGDRIFSVLSIYLSDALNNHILSFNRKSNSTLWNIKVKGRVNEMDISSDGNHIAVATQFNFYYLNHENPIIDNYFQLKLIISYIALGSFIGLGVFTGLAFFIRQWKEKAYLEKIAGEWEFS